MACSEEQCNDCNRVVKTFRISSNQPHAFIVHVDYSLYEAVKKEDGGKEKKTSVEKEKSKRRKEEKKVILEKLSAIACALRNTKGGSILVHLCGQKKENRYLGFFDEFVSDAFTYLIEDGKLYVETYRRFWLDELRDFKKTEGFVCINVNKSSGISIVDFCSRIRNDFEITKPSPLNILTFLKSFALSAEESGTTEDKRSAAEKTTDERKTPETRSKRQEEGERNKIEERKPIVRGIRTSDLQECRTVELKSVFHCKQITKDTEVSDFVEFVWNNLKLKHNIVSMSKVDDGGSYYVGIAEKSFDERRCNIKPEPEGFFIHGNKEEYTTEIKQKVRSEILVLNPDLTFTSAPEDLITITFHPYQKKFILEVSIRKFDGLVFCDKEGPLAYVIKNDYIQRMSKEDVLDRALQVYKIKDNNPVRQ